MNDIIRQNLNLILQQMQAMGMSEMVAVLNEIRSELHQISPFKNEPVDLVIWVPNEEVFSNSYNPNSVNDPEMELLATSIRADGYTQPVVTWVEVNKREVIDGHHRSLTGKNNIEIRNRIHGYLPVVTANADRTDVGDRMASTVRHNRARGKHAVEKMSDMVVELKKRGWNDAKISKQLGMDSDEVLRLCQITGLARLFADREFSQAWEAELSEGEEISETLIDA